MTTVLKVGGSVLTAKDRVETIDRERLAAVTQAIANRPDGPLILVHGGGSFGHPVAHCHGVSRTEGTTDGRAVLAIHRAMKRLNDAVLDALHGVGEPAVPVHPLSIGHRTADGTLQISVDGVSGLLTEGFLPVLHGDVIAHEGLGATILSGDELVVYLARACGADRLGLCSTVPGVLDGDGRVVPRIDRYGDVAGLVGESEVTDVTGGMAEKVRTLLSVPTPAHLFGPEDIDAFLSGESVGTVVGGE